MGVVGIVERCIIVPVPCYILLLLRVRVLELLREISNLEYRRKLPLYDVFESVGNDSVSTFPELRCQQ
jgi:hypothetical protein